MCCDFITHFDLDGQVAYVSSCVPAATAVAHQSADASQSTGANAAVGTPHTAASGVHCVKCIQLFAALAELNMICLLGHSV